MKFVQLHLHTSFSVLDGVNSPEEFAAKAKQVGMPALAITDHGNMSGILRFYNACRKEEIKPIIGCEFYVNNNRSKGKEARDNHHIVLLAKNKEGYKNLLKINYDSFNEGFYYKGRTSEPFMFEHSDGLVCTSACMASTIASFILNKEFKKAENVFLQYKEAFGKDFYGELHFNEVKDQIKVTKGIYELCKKHKVKYIITGDCHYIEKEDARTQDILLMINTRKRESDSNVFRFSARNLYFHLPKDYMNFNKKFGYNFPDRVIQEGLMRTLEIVEKCNFEMLNKDSKFPAYVNEDGIQVNAPLILVKKCHNISKSIFPKDKEKEYKGRLEKELKVITEKGFADYFLIIEDIIKFCKKKNIGVGAGRGSAAGSLVSYVLGITRVDPIRFGLLFERFLNSERKDPPDIDLDFESGRKSEIEDYLKNKYGRDRVAHIITFSTFRPKGALRNVARVLNKDRDMEFATIIKRIEDDPRGSFGVIGQLESLMENLDKSEISYIKNNMDMFRIADKLVGKIRQQGQHAAGVAITPGPIYDYIPIQKIRGEIVTGLTEGKDYRELSEVGILKIDILGLDQVNILKDALEMALKNTGQEIDLDNIDLEDKKLYKALNKYPSMGLFQFENQGIDAYVKSVQPFCFEDISAINAMYRPAILNSGEHIKFLENRKKILEQGKVYQGESKEMREILSPTYGIIAYQEQFIEILHRIGGFSLQEADKARKTFKMLYLRNTSTENKKEDPELLEVADRFRKGALEKGISEIRVDKLINKLAEFAEYSFNKSHSVSYSVVTMQTLYMREYFPLFYYSSLLNHAENSEKNYGFRKENKAAKYFNFIKMRGVNFLPIDINKSSGRFEPEKNKIRIPLTFIKGIGESLSEVIIQHRPFLSLSDFFRKELNFKSNKTSIMALIKAGAFDNLFDNKRAIYKFYEEWNPLKSKYRKAKPEKIKQDMKLMWDKYKNIRNWTEEEMIQIEAEVCNFNIFYSDENIWRKIEYLADKKRIVSIQENNKKEDQYYCFQIESIKDWVDKNGNDMCFISAKDWMNNQLEIKVFANIFQEIKKGFLKKGEYYLMTGYNKENSVIAHKYNLSKKAFILLKDLENI